MISMGKVGFFVLCMVLIPSMSLGLEVPEGIQIITEEYAPLNYYENGTLKGISVDLMEMILQKMGSSINRSSFQVLPWYQGYNNTQNIPNTVLFSTGRLPEREDLFLWAGPIMTDRQVLFIMQDFNPSELKNLSSIKVAAVRDDRGVHFALDAGAVKENIIEVPKAREAINLLINGTAQAFAYGETAGEHVISQYAEESSKIIVGKEIGVIVDYYAFNKNTSGDFVREFNETLQNLKNSTNGEISEYEKIVSRYK